MHNSKIVHITTSEIEIITRHYTYEVLINEDKADDFTEKMDELCGHKEIYDELSQHDYKFISREDGKQYPTDDNFSSCVDEVKILNQLAWSL